MGRGEERAKSVPSGKGKSRVNKVVEAKRGLTRRRGRHVREEGEGRETTTLAAAWASSTGGGSSGGQAEAAKGTVLKIFHVTLERNVKFSFGG